MDRLSNALQVITRGIDSSGRTIRGTRQAFQRYDKINAHVGGKLVIVQGAFSNADASAGTHTKAGCFDYRRWNLTSDEARTVVHRGRDLGGATWERTRAQGFDPHFHDICIGDAPMDDLARAQIDMYRKGYNGLGWYDHRDEDPYRPKVIRAYVYEEDDMFEAADREMLRNLHNGFQRFREGEVARDQSEAERDKRRFERLIAQKGEVVDDLTLLINKSEGEIRDDLKALKRRLLAELKDDPDVTGPDNPSDDAMADEGL